MLMKITGGGHLRHPRYSQPSRCTAPAVRFGVLVSYWSSALNVVISHQAPGSAVLSSARNTSGQWWELDSGPV